MQRLFSVFLPAAWATIAGQSGLLFLPTTFQVPASGFSDRYRRIDLASPEAC